MIRHLGCIHHFDGLMNMRVKRLPSSFNRLQRKFLQRSLQLLVDQLHAIAELGGIGLHFQCPLKAVEHGQQRFDGIGCRVVAKILLLLGGPTPCVFELRLRARQTIDQRIALRFQLFEFRTRWRRRT